MIRPDRSSGEYQSDLETGEPTRKVAWVGPYQTDWPTENAEVLVMSDEAYTTIDRRNTIARKAQRGEETWSSLLEQFGRDEVWSVLGPVIRDARNLLEDEDLDGSDEAMQKCLVAAKESDMWPYAYQPLDDADVILAGLPEAVVEMGRRGSVSPMTDYSPCSWDAADLPRIREILAETGWEVCSTTFHPVWP